MMSFKDFLSEREKNPRWVKGSALALVTKINDIEKQIKQEKNSRKRDELMAKQVKNSALIAGLGIALKTKDRGSLARFKKKK